MMRCLLGLGLLLLSASGLWALEEGTTAEIEVSGQLSEEEQQLLEMLEMLQNYDLLDEIDLFSVMEEEE